MNLLAIAITVGAIVLARSDLSSLDWLDQICLALFCLFLGSYFVPVKNADGHESAAERLAFRAGKQLNRIIKRRH